MNTRLIATAPIVTGQGHRLQRGDLIAVCDAPQAAELLGDLGNFTVVNFRDGFELRQQNQFGETVSVEFRSPLNPPIESGTLSAMWRTGMARIASVDDDQVPEEEEPPSGDPDDPELPVEPDPELPVGPVKKPKGPRKPKD